MSAEIQKLGFYVTPEHPCNYLPDRQAITLFADPNYPKDLRLYSLLASNGFRRSGEYLYQPHCNNCHACVPVRVCVGEFHPGRSQNRIWKRNQDLEITVHPAKYNQAHYDLYRRYINIKHTGGGMDNPGPDDYMNFLTSSWMDTIFYEMKLANRLLAVAVVDRMDDSLSAVYTFYDPDYPNRSLGTFSILYELDEANRLGMNWLYLGYWINGCAKMSYKNRFLPIEYYQDGQWQRSMSP